MSNAVSVVICTRNPRKRVLAQALKAIAAQQGNVAIELIVVDNGSAAPLQESDLSPAAALSPILHREERPGLFFARQAGMRLATHDLLVLVDDDNELSPTYVASARRIADREPFVGAFGGKAKYAGDRPASAFKTPFLPYLGVKDEGEEDITGSGDKWGPHEPIGAGMVVRKTVADAYIEFVSRSADPVLGRTGKHLMSGEDSLLVRLAHTLGYKIGYRSELSLNHMIDFNRLKLRHLSRLLIGHGRSYVRLARMCNQPLTDPPLRPLDFAKRLVWVTSSQGLPRGLANLFWTYGYEKERETPPLDDGFPRLDIQPAGSLPV